MRTVLILAVALAGTVGAYAYWRQSAAVAQAEPSSLVRSTPEVHVAIAVERDVPVYVRGVGRVEPSMRVEIKSRLDGPITKVSFAEGSEVQAGEALFEIDPRPYAAALAQSEGQLARDEALLTEAKANFDRVSNLLTKEFASRQAFDQQKSLVDQLSATVKIDRAVYENSRLTLDFTTIRAPFAGRVGKRRVDVGSLVHAADDTVLVQLFQVNPISVILAVPQDDLSEVSQHQQTQDLPMEALTSDDHRVLDRGRLVLIGDVIDAQSGTIDLKGLFDNPDGALWPGQLVDGRIITQMRKQVVAVPGGAVQAGPAGKFVYVVGEKGLVELRPVSLALPVPGLAIVESGLRPGERVVIDGHDQVAPGMIVEFSSGSSDTEVKQEDLGSKAGGQPS
jgi:membrane fusion protein, multidrug efflux system